MLETAGSEAIQNAVLERLDLLQAIRETFLTLYPDPPRSFRPGLLHSEILGALQINPWDGWNRRAVNEALVSFGYTHVKSNGTFFLKKNPRKKNSTRRLAEIGG